MSRTYLIKVHHDQIIDPDPCNVRQWLVRVGKAGKSVLVEIIHWIRSCYPRKWFIVDNAMQQKDDCQWMESQRVDGRTYPIGGHPKWHFTFILFLTWLIRFMTQQTFYDSPHPNLEHDSHSTHTLLVIPSPHLSYYSHNESCHTSFSQMFWHFLSSL